MRGEGGVLGAAALVVTAMAVISLSDNWVRHAVPEMGLWQFQAMRCVICCAAVALGAVMLGWRLRPVSLGRMVLRSAVASLSVMLYFGALALMPIAQAAAGLFTAPLFVLLISVAAFALPVGPVRWLAVVLGFAGVLVVLRPWGGEAGGLAPLPALLAVAAGALHAAGAVLTRQLCAGEPTAGMTFAHFLAMGLWGLAGMAAVAVFGAPGAEGWFTRGAVVPSWPVMGWMTANALGSVLGIALLIRAYQIAEASRITVFEYSFLPFVALWALLLFAERPDAATVLGTALIALAGGIIALRSAPRVAAQGAGP